MSEFEKRFPKPKMGDDLKTTKIWSMQEWLFAKKVWLEALNWIDENHRPSGYDGIAILDEIEELENK